MTSPVRIWCLWLAVLSLPHLLAANGPDLCVVTRLSTPAFSASLAQSSPSRGCFSRLVTPRGQEVHAIRLSTKRTARQHVAQAPPLVTLNVRAPTDGRSYSRNIVLVLDSSSAVDWSILSPAAFSNGTSFQIIVTQRSRVVQCELSPVTVHSQRVRGREALVKFMQRKLQAITSFTDVSSADTIDLTVGIDGTAPDTCDTQKGLRAHAGLVPKQWRPVPLDGCFNRHLAGLGQRDVYVVEVTESGTSFRNTPVNVHLISDGTRKSAATNITLILKAAAAMSWDLTSDSFSGDLLVLAESPVRGDGLGAGVSLSMEQVTLPQSFNDLVLYAVTFSSGPPVAYLRAPAVSKLDIRLGDAADGADRGSPEDSRATVRATPGEWNSQEEEWDEDYWADPSSGHIDSADSAGSLRGSVAVTCSSGRLVVAVPAALAEDVAVSSLHLSEPGCRSRSNGTHLVVNEPLLRCGTERRDAGNGDTAEVFFNTVYFVSSLAPMDDEDFEGSGGGLGADLEDADVFHSNGGSVPVSCSVPKNGRQQTQEVWRDVDQVGFVYGLELAVDSQFRSPIGPNLLVPVSHSIFVRPTLHIASYLHPVLERCWVSGASDPSSPRALLLVDSACPVLPSVMLVRTDSDGGAVYRFEVTRQFVELGPYYLHCSVGVCSGAGSPARQVVPQCRRGLSSRCTEGGSLGEQLASGAQTITRGPLLSTMTGGGGAATGRRPVVQWGVSSETVAGIGVSAFLLGVALMAGVWLIHTKIGPSKRHHFQPVPQNGGIETAAPSANSTPNSQTPIILAGRSPAPAAV